MDSSASGTYVVRRHMVVVGVASLIRPPFQLEILAKGQPYGREEL